ncbi:MAG TPA: nuclear transport factor 2 family protein [Thermomicrobiales bacterium]|nr:nuclear transport factor 2 family protein [Thermomicrobiales bacterium]
MDQNATPAALARAFTAAWASHDLDAAAAYVADDVTFDGPMNHLRGKAAYLEALGGFAEVVTGVEIIAAIGDDTQALIMYDLATAPFGTLTSAELLTFRDGKIRADRLIFDTHLMRQAATSRPPVA